MGFGIDADSVLSISGLALFAGVFLLPFLQEDAAVIAAATASLAGAGASAALFAVVFAGLCASDIWKYWLGALARRHAWAQRFAARRGVSAAGRVLHEAPVKTLFMARFVPGTRIPTYIACGFFRLPYARFVFFVALTALAYVSVVFALFHTVGAVAGEAAIIWLPAIAIALLASYMVYRWRRGRRAAREETCASPPSGGGTTP
jgi:membrane protein DedA with SNARE-associated domain